MSSQPLGPSAQMMALSHARLPPAIGRRSPSGRHAVSGYLQKATLVSIAGTRGQPTRNTDLAEMAGCSEDAVKNALVALREAGLIRPVNSLTGFQRPVGWEVVWEALVEFIPADSLPLAPVFIPACRRSA